MSPLAPTGRPDAAGGAAAASDSTGTLPAARRTLWHTLPALEVERLLESGDSGLSAAAAAERLERYGPNAVENERPDPWWALLLRQLRDPLIYILLAAAAVTLALRDYADSVVVIAVVVVNTLIGFTQEYRAREAMRALAKLSAPHAEVVRDGAVAVVESRDLVPGDVVLLASGARVPADLRMLAARDLEVDESALTGESLAVRKHTEPLAGETLVPGDQVNMAFAGTTVTRGRGRGLVVRTGQSTELGQIARSMQEVGRTATPLQRKMARFGRQVGALVLALSALVAVIGAFRAMPPSEIFLTAVALAVSAVPEGLPVVLTVTLAIGVRRMARRKAIIRSLPAVETLGSTTAIGSDKTGTLTKNEMTVRAVWAGGRTFEVTGAGYELAGEVRHDGHVVLAADDEALRATLLALTLANEADAHAAERGAPTGDPTEIALFVAAFKGGVPPVESRARFRELDILPFEPERRLMATLNAGGDGDESRVLYVKGAPEAILPRCRRILAEGGEAELDVEEARRAAASLAARGLRVLAAAYRPGAARLDDEALEDGLVFTGLVGMEDPVRPEAVRAVAGAGEAGIRVLMLTGDHVETARAIAAQLGLHGVDRALSGHEIQALSDAELDLAMRDTAVFARVAPEHKLRIVQRLKAAGDVVAVTGDGVNDAPALRAAHLGVAMGATGTDVAREAADMVLADDNFATITAAVEEGRVVFANIRKVTFFLLSTAAGEIVTILVALLAGWPLPLVAAQILWINLVTNGLQDVALAFEPGEPGLLRRPPRPVSEGVLTWPLVERLGGVGIVLAAGTLGIFWWAWRSTGDLDLARTMAMTQMVVFQFFHVFNCRSLDRSVLSIPLFSNRLLFASIVAAALAHVAVLHVPALQGVFRTVALTGQQWLVIVAVATFVVFGGELDKWINRRRGRVLG